MNIIVGTKIIRDIFRRKFQETMLSVFVLVIVLLAACLPSSDAFHAANNRFGSVRSRTSSLQMMGKRLPLVAGNWKVSRGDLFIPSTLLIIALDRDLCFVFRINIDRSTSTYDTIYLPFKQKIISR